MIDPFPKRLAKKSFTLRQLSRQYVALRKHANWNRLVGSASIQNSAKLQSNSRRPRILIPTSVGGHIGSVNLEGLIGIALMLRGADVEFALCDEKLPACLACETGFLGELKAYNSTHVSKIFCKACYRPAIRSLNRIGTKIHRFSEWLTTEDVHQSSLMADKAPAEKILEAMYQGLSVGEHAYAGTLRFFARGDLKNEPNADRILRQYLRAAILTANIFNRLLSTKSYDCVVFNHGIYVPQGIIGALCRQKGIRIANWNPAYRKQCFIFSHGDTYHHTMLSEPVAKWEDINWNDGIDKHLMGYLDSRRKGTRDWIWFQNKVNM